MPIEDEPILPEGWIRKEVKRKTGNRTDIYIYSPAGTLFRSKTTLKKYIDAKKLPFRIENFNFSITKINEMNNKNESFLGHPVTSDKNTDTPDKNKESPDNSLDVNENTSSNKENLSENPEEVKTDNILEMSQNLLEISESCFQLKYEKERTEKTLLSLEKEAKDTIEKMQEEIEILNKVKSNLKIKIENQEEEILYLKKSIASSKKTQNCQQTCGNCNVLSHEISTLKSKISSLRKDNLSLMNEINPCPSPDGKLLEKIKKMETKIRDLEKEAVVNIANQEEIIRVLKVDLDTLNTENSKLRSESTALKKQNEEFVEEKRMFCQNTVVRSVSSKNPTKPSSKLLKINQENKRNLLIVADSHGRYLTSSLTSMWPNNDYNISMIIKPNAIMAEVIKDAKGLTKSFSKSDTFIVIGGSNDEIGQAEKCITGLYKKMLDNTKHTNVFVSSFPYRHHTPGLNNKISFLNIEIEKLVSRYDHASFLPINELPRHFYTRHGLHFNKGGKQRIAFMLKEMFYQKSLVNPEPPIKPNSINVVEADMWRMIDKNQDNSSVAFAHTISSDLDCDRSMSAGVATVFKKKFDKPKARDYIDTKLTCQILPNGATIYSLVTKPVYYGKPTTEDYDEAFEQLIDNFKKKNFKTLICSPMGCVRDHVQVEHFARNIKKLHQATGATVSIICSDQPYARRTLWNGLSYPVFLEKLQKAVNIDIATIPTKFNSPTCQVQPNPAPVSPTVVPVNPTDTPNSPTLVPGPQSFSEAVKSTPVQKQSNVKVVTPDQVEGQVSVVNQSTNCSLGLN